MKAPAHTQTTIRTRARRSLVSCILFLAVGLAFATTISAHADPLVCVTAYYTINNGPKQYVANNECRVPTSWGPATGSGPSCTGLAPALAICYTVIISGP